MEKTSDKLTINEIGKVMMQYPIDGKRSEELFAQEPALQDAFTTFARKYADDFDKIIGVDLKTAAKEKLRDLFSWSLTVGYLLKGNLLRDSFDNMLLKEDMKMKKVKRYFTALEVNEQEVLLKRLRVQKIEDAPPQKALNIINEYLQEEYPDDFPPDE